MRLILGLLFAISFVSTVNGAVGVDFTTYKRDIIDRMPFGAPPPEPVVQPIQQPVSPQQRIAPLNSIFLLVAVVDTSQGTYVGFINRRSKKSYYKEVGDPAEDDVQVIEAYPDEEAALLDYKGKREKLVLPGASSASMQAAAQAAGGNSSVGDGSGNVLAPKKKSKVLSYRERYKERLRALEDRRKEAAEKRTQIVKSLTKEQFEEHMKAYQMEIIRAQGEIGPPVPIPLTPEMDDQLVKEGYLPPNE